MRRIGTGLVISALATLALGTAIAFAVTGSSSPTPHTAYFNGVSAGVGKTSVHINVNARGTRVSTVLTCYLKHGVSVQADNGLYTYPLHHGSFSFDKTYEVDKFIQQNGETVQETGHGKVLLTGRFTNGTFVGKVQIRFAGYRKALHYGSGCRKVSYVASPAVG